MDHRKRKILSYSTYLLSVKIRIGINEIDGWGRKLIKEEIYLQ